MDDVVTVVAAVLYDPRRDPPWPEDLRPYLRSEKNEVSCGNIRDIVDFDRPTD